MAEKKKRKGLTIVLIIAAVIIIGVIIGGNSGDSSSSKEKTIIKVGDTFKTNKMEIKVISIEKRKKVGDDIFGEKASEGGVYIAVYYQYKNISDKAIGAFSQPSVKLIDPKGTKYDSDLGATTSYVTEDKINIDEKVLSDLNPGITVKDAEVFEVSEELLKDTGWQLIIDADQDAFVELKL